jgi:hypothetical protein
LPNPGYKRLRRALRARPRRGRARCHAVKERDHVFHLGTVEALRDEHDLAAPIRIRPALEPRQIVQKMLRALDHRGAIGFFRDIDDALHTQQVRPEILLKRIEQKPQRLARDRLVAREAERGDVAIVQMVTIVIGVIIVAVIMPVARVVMVRVGMLIGLGIEPGARVGLGIGAGA